MLDVEDGISDEFDDRDDDAALLRAPARPVWPNPYTPTVANPATRPPRTGSCRPGRGASAAAKPGASSPSTSDSSLDDGSSMTAERNDEEAQSTGDVASSTSNKSCGTAVLVLVIYGAVVAHACNLVGARLTATNAAAAAAAARRSFSYDNLPMSEACRLRLDPSARGLQSATVSRLVDRTRHRWNRVLTFDTWFDSTRRSLTRWPAKNKKMKCSRSNAYT